MWDLIFVDPLTNVLLVFYKLLGGQTMLAVALLTLVVRLLLTPLTLSQQKSARKQQELQPQMMQLREKYKNDQQRLAVEQQKLFREAGVNPLGGCLPSLIQFPLMIALYQAIIRALAATPLELLNLPVHIYRWIPGLNLSLLVPLQSTFLGLDLALPPNAGTLFSYSLPLLVGLTTWYSQKIMTPPSADPQSQSMSQTMLLTMPLFLGLISLQYAAGLSIYFIISNLVTILQFFLFRSHYNTAPVPAAQPAAQSEPAEKPRVAEPAPKPKPAKPSGASEMVPGARVARPKLSDKR